ncbi:MAG TPA: TIGR03086 family metal-binding protein [Nakamurella sp.]
MAESDDPSSVVADLERALRGTGNVVVGVRQDQWTDATPCPDWDVRALVNHLVFGSRTFTGILRGEKPPPQSEIRTMRDRDQLGDDPVGAYRGSADKLVVAPRQPGVLARTFPSPLGRIPGAAIGQLRITETLVHGWDLARATGQRMPFEDDLARSALEFTLRRLPPGASRASFAFGPELEAPESAPAIDRLAAHLGRRGGLVDPGHDGRQARRGADGAAVPAHGNASEPAGRSTYGHRP